MIRKILIANRGEIARRVIRTAREMGIETVALCTAEEENAPWVKEANESFKFAESELSQSYLNIDQIVEFALQCKADAIHPGYGFLSENALFAEKVEEAGMAFVGPRAESIEAMGNKLNASAYAEKAGIPVQKMHKGSKDELLKLKDQLSYPVLIKAAAGGGGKGMKKVYKAENYEQALVQTARESKAYFGNDDVYVERLVTSARHIEVQVIGDGNGDAIHLGERDCTMQRRHQKVLEEAPAAILTQEQREEVTSYAVQLAKAMKYRSAGTVEFLFDESGKFWFLEMNTRIQVEHPVSEMITGRDIVRLQIEIAAGKPLTFSQDQITFNGHAIEARLYAEKPHKDFLPDAGPVYHLSFPHYDWLRIDSSIENRGFASPNFDPMISKISVWGNDRNEAIQRLSLVLDETRLAGVETNKHFLRELANSEVFIGNNFHTRFIEESYQYETKNENPEKYIAALISDSFLNLNQENNAWNTGYFRQIPVNWKIQINDDNYNIKWSKVNKKLNFEYQGGFFEVDEIQWKDNTVGFDLNGNKVELFVYKHKGKLWIFDKGKTIRIERLLPKSGKKNQAVSGRQVTLEAPMFGKVLSINAPMGADIKEGDTLLVIEAMKMENHLHATGNAKVKNILVKEGEQVSDGQILMEFE